MTGPIGQDADRVVEQLLALKEEEIPRAVSRLGRPAERELMERWIAWAHGGQMPPGDDWRVWLIRAGRGFGKTRAGSEWVSEVARSTPDARIALVGATDDEVRRVMIEGASGLLAVARREEAVRWVRSAGEVQFASGATGYVYSAEAPERLRGPEHHAAWCDELAKWRGGETAWDNLMLGLRLGEQPRAVVTTTPRPNALMRKVLAMRGLIETRGRTGDNPHMSNRWVAAMRDTYGGTRLGRQELDGELVEEVAGALWTRALIERCRVAAPPDLVRVVVGVDPPATAEGDLCGIVAAGVDAGGVAHVLRDASVGGLSPDGWARAVTDCARAVGADRVVAEVNQGGDLVAHVLRGLPVQEVRATRSKGARAEPIAVAYERGLVRHVGAFPELENQLCGFQRGGGYTGAARSPDRADACVWALWALLVDVPAQPGVRSLA